jgi:glycosyltransferase involved in cell wall biosynthesis
MFQPATELRHVIAAYDQVIAWDADIVHDHTTIGPFYAERFPGLHVVTTAHGPFEGDHRAVYRALAGRVPLIAISRCQAAAACVEIAAVIHHAVDADNIDEGKGAGGYAAFLGRMNANKGLPTAIRASRAAGIPLRIAAKMKDHDEQLYFRECIKPMLGGSVEYVGEVDRREKYDLLGDAVCLLNPIEWPEPFGMVMIEALACGTPVVATPNGAAPEIVENGVTGFLRCDEASIVDALSNLDDLSRYACRDVAEEHFSLERLAAEHIAVYESVCGGER